MASLDAARRQLALHGEALLARTIAASRRAREAIDAIPGCRVVGERAGRAPGRGRLGPAADRHRRARHRLHRLRGRRRAARRLRHPRRARHARDDRARARARPARRRARALRPRLRARPCGGSSGRATPRRSCAPRARSTTRSSCRRARRSSARPRWSPVDDAVGRVSAESIAGYPPGIPALLPGERITAEVVAYLRELRDVGRAPARRERPGLPRPSCVLCDVLTPIERARSTRALAEDVGDGDVTTAATVAADARARARRSPRRRRG